MRITLIIDHENGMVESHEYPILTREDVIKDLSTYFSPAPKPEKEDTVMAVEVSDLPAWNF